MTRGGQRVFIEGSNFGPAGSAYLDSVTCVHPTHKSGANPTHLVPCCTPARSYKSVLAGPEMEAVNCSVTIDHSLIECLTAEGAGTLLHWRLIIAGQQSSAPTTSYEAPSITHVWPVTPGLDLASFRSSGGDVVALDGHNLGDKDECVGRVTTPRLPPRANTHV